MMRAAQNIYGDPKSDKSLPVLKCQRINGQGLQDPIDLSETAAACSVLGIPPLLGHLAHSQLECDRIYWVINDFAAI